jgi:hypothetical protein
LFAYACFALGGTGLVFAVPLVGWLLFIALGGAVFLQFQFAGTVMQGVGLGFVVIVAGSLLCATAYHVLNGQTQNTLILVGIASLMTVGVFYTKFSTIEFFQFLYPPAFNTDTKAGVFNDVVVAA